MADASTGWLDAQHLEPDTQSYPFLTIQDLKHKVRHARQSTKEDRTSQSQYLLFTNVTHETAENICHHVATLIGKASRIFYEASSNRLLIKLSSRPHEEAAGQISRLIIRQTESMGLGDALSSTGSATVREGRSGKEPDSSYMLENPPAGRRGQWPNVVVEVGYSSSDFSVKLSTDAAWWIVSSRGDVQLAIVVHISREQPHILIELWGATILRLYRPRGTGVFESSHSPKCQYSASE
ncbi:hypothetical protein AJ79_03480 [Helicocarpus griseus UAMH5409]|uniref:Uncharacterized protein n=1 Tax=Helicocarpus griseus UAMH5409 TaxID=1447875 RepID=A0A2B7XXM6_9EURO|nr:hypothetical protein AJ79_03480 [Helicocarpus griseus UAMH5409]